MTESTGNQKRSISLLRCVGYGLLLLAFLSFLDIFIPLRLMNPLWELSTIGALVERVVIPLLGLGMVFYGQDKYREDWEIPLLKGLSWSCLIVSLLFALLIPLGINSTVRLYSIAQEQVTTQANHRLTEIREYKQKLTQASGKDLEPIFARIPRNGVPLSIKNPEELNNFKNRFLLEIDKAEKTLNSQNEVFQTSEGIGLIKNSIKSNLGAVICGILFVRIWRLTRWARRLA